MTKRPLDKIILSRLEMEGILGTRPQERLTRQKIWIDLELFISLHPAGKTDQLNKTVDYEKVCEAVREFVDHSSFHLAEALAEALAERILGEFPIEGILIRIFKPDAIPQAEKVGVEIYRKK